MQDYFTNLSFSTGAAGARWALPSKPTVTADDNKALRCPPTKKPQGQRWAATKSAHQCPPSKTQGGQRHDKSKPLLTKDFSASAPAAHPAHRVLEGNATHWHEQYEERIAIRQHDGELPIEEAIYLSRWATLHQFVVLHHPSVMAEFETAINQPVRH